MFFSTNYSMLRPVKIAFSFLALLYIAFHLVTLSYSPLPWYDETYFASMALNFIDHHSFIPMIAYHAKVLKEDLAYGPVYFILTGLSFKLFGFGIFQFRIVNLLFGFLLIWLLLEILRIYHFSKTTILIITTAFMLDPFLQLSLHEARMDLVTLALMLSSAFIILRSMEGNNIKRSDIFLSGLLAGAALLTTPRIGFMYITLSIVIIIWLINNFSKKNLLNITLWFLPVLIVYAFWMFYAFGGVQELLSYYKERSKESLVGYAGFFKPVYFIPKHEWLLMICAMISLLYKLVSEDLKFNYFYLFSLLSIIFFYIIVVDLGPYSVLIIPFYYFIIADSLKGFSFKEIKNPFLYLALILLLFNLSYFSFKGLQVVASLEQRDYKQPDAFIKNYIPKGSKVLGDPIYFYSVIKAGSDFQYFNKNASNEKREKMHREQYDYDYLIITDQSRLRDPEAVLLYLSNSKFKKVARFEKELSYLTKKLSGLSLISTLENSGYNADLYVRLKFDQSLPTAMIND
jgi:4-amino-4-deoxy-L-arabinose transferase-like glycosyltransferase